MICTVEKSSPVIKLLVVKKKQKAQQVQKASSRSN